MSAGNFATGLISTLITTIVLAVIERTYKAKGDQMTPYGALALWVASSSLLFVVFFIVAIFKGEPK